MIELGANATDDPAFLVVASRLLTGEARAHHAPQVTAVHVDHWFGERWLGFRGKILGAAGVRSRRLRSYLGVPPFHPNRVVAVQNYRFEPGAQRYAQSFGPELHGAWRSERNVDRQLWASGLYAWYSGDTRATQKGVVMVYAVHPRYRLGWYATFENTTEWQLTKTIGIAPGRIAELMKLGATGGVAVTSSAASRS